MGRLFSFRFDNLLQLVPLRIKDLLRHQLEIRGDSRLESHVGKNVFLQIDAGSDFDQSDFSIHQREYSPFGDIEDGLFVYRRVFSAECNLFNLVDKLKVVSLLQDLDLPIFGLYSANSLLNCINLAKSSDAPSGISLAVPFSSSYSHASQKEGGIPFPQIYRGTFGLHRPEVQYLHDGPPCPSPEGQARRLITASTNPPSWLVGLLPWAR